LKSNHLNYNKGSNYSDIFPQKYETNFFVANETNIKYRKGK